MIILNHPNKEALRIFYQMLTKHYKRGNWHHKPQPILAYRLALSARWICNRCPMNKIPRYLQDLK